LRLPCLAYLVFLSWLLDVPAETGIVNLSNVLLSDGKGGFVKYLHKCFLCGQNGGLKMKCDSEHCCTTSDGKELTVMHVTCARQAGMEVRLDDTDDLYFYGTFTFRSRSKFCFSVCSQWIAYILGDAAVRCYRHGGNEFNLRAQLEDMLEVEKKRTGKDHARADSPIKFSDASRILNAGIQVMRTLGWAWRWTEWWVDYDSSWEPFLEPGQNERNMTKEELKIVDSTRDSRCADVRRCRLAALGAALRNRDYDTAGGFNNAALDRALRAVLHTESLVGPLQQVEIDFFIEWLGRAYRSKSRLLCLGEHKNQISEETHFCVHITNKSPKFVLGNRPVPASQISQSKVQYSFGCIVMDLLCLERCVAHQYLKQKKLEETLFEVGINEIDDFMQRDLIDSPISSSCGTTIALKKAKPPFSTAAAKGKRKRDKLVDDTSSAGKDAAVAFDVKKWRRDRPPRYQDQAILQVPTSKNVAATSMSDKRLDSLLTNPNDAIFHFTEFCATTTTTTYSGKKRGRPDKFRNYLAPTGTSDSATASPPYSGMRPCRASKKKMLNEECDKQRHRSARVDNTQGAGYAREFPVTNTEDRRTQTETCNEEILLSRPRKKQMLGGDADAPGKSLQLGPDSDNTLGSSGEREFPAANTEENVMQINMCAEEKPPCRSSANERLEEDAEVPSESGKRSIGTETAQVSSGEREFPEAATEVPYTQIETCTEETPYSNQAKEVAFSVSEERQKRALD
jgi:hypothetical protein